MDKFLRVIFLSILILSSSLVSAQECVPPMNESCAFYRPDNSFYIGVKVNFLSNRFDQIVYLDVGCEGRYVFTPQSSVLNKNIPIIGAELKFMYCIGNKFINTQTVRTGGDSKIICNASNKLICNKIRN